MEPIVSVILPVYNAERYLSAAVQSVLDQTYADFEFIIIDDGSTDGSKKILQEFAAKDSRIRLISRPNTGYVIALNQAIDVARGQFIARMDADDINVPGRFEKQVDYLQQHPDCVLLGAKVCQMDGDGFIIGPMLDIEFGHEKILHSLLQRGWPIVHPTVMMRAEAVRKIGGYVPEFCPNEDHDLFLKMSEIGRLENLPEPLFYYRKHLASQTNQKRDRTDALIGTIIINACRRRQIPFPDVAVHPPIRCEDLFKTELAWAWIAVKSGNIRTARKYAMHAMTRRPWARDSWRLAFCAMRGH